MASKKPSPRPTICDACEQEYDTLRRIPKFLKCFHTFCLLCLQNFIINETTIDCPTCAQETNLQYQPIDKSLQTNFYIMNLLSAPVLPAIAENSDYYKENRYYWCLTCNATVMEDASCLKNHDTHDLKTDAGREMAENHLKMLFVTCKAQLNGSLAKLQEAQLAFPAAQIALQAVQMQIDIRSKENEAQITELRKQLSNVANRLSKPLEEKCTEEDIYSLFQEYNQLMIELKQKKTIEFDSIRNSVVSIDIRNPNGGKLTIPLFDSALINFPSEGTNEQESHLLTSLSVLILLSTLKEPWTTSSLPQKKSFESTKKYKVKTFETVNKTEASGREFERKKTSKPIRRAASEVGKRPESFESTKRDQSIPNQCLSSKRTDSDRNCKQSNGRPISREQHTSNEPLSTKWNPFSPTFQPSSTALQYHVSQPSMMMPSPTSLQNKKVCFILAVNGKHYGSIVIDLRPDLAPEMCQKFVQSCQATEGPTYRGTIIYQSKPKTFIMGGKVLGPESLYMADPSPLKKTRGAIFFRLKRDYVKSQCSIVSTEFCIHLAEESHENHRTSTVFGYVCDGLAVCDAISYMDCSRDHVAIAKATVV